MSKTTIHSAFAVFFLLMLTRCAPSFQREIKTHRDHYRQEFLDNQRSPLTEADLPYLRFYEPDPAYRVEASFKPAEGAEPFEMATYAGTTQPYVKHGTATFSLGGKEYRLAIYRNLNLMRMPQYRDYLFLPFKDFTNGETTYGGGRYLDFRESDIENGRLTIDFNKAYNPYCAYSDGYQCPVPPMENHLETAIEAGEKTFARPDAGDH